MRMYIPEIEPDGSFARRYLEDRERERKEPKHLPRLDDAYYRGGAFIHFTLGIEDRATGWLTPAFHQAWQLTLLHAAGRYQLICPTYVLMPDHLHVFTVGVHEHADHLTALEFLRRNLRSHLVPAKWQRQVYDHVLREYERERGAFAGVANYILENPVKEGLSASVRDYPSLGCCVPGYPELDVAEPDYWESFWRIHQRLWNPRGSE